MAPGSINGWLTCVDSGENSGYANFQDGVLRRAFLTTIDEAPVASRDTALAIVEIPDRIRVNPKSIIKLALNAGRWLQHLSLSRSVEAVEASAWKASTDPDVLARRILAILTPEERAVIPKTRSALGYDHNVIDAIGLGLWRLGRMGRGGRKIR